MSEKNKGKIAAINKKEDEHRIEEMAANMEKIYQNAKECKEIVCALEDAFVEISKIVKTLTIMSAQTNQLAQKTALTVEENRDIGK